jgi:plastocyanin
MRVPVLWGPVFVAICAAGCSKEPPAPAAQPPVERAQPGAASSAVVAGKVSHVAEGSRAIVVLESRSPREFPSPTEPKVMDQQGLTFIPGLLVVRQGQPVLFRNSEDVLHNVRVGESGTAQPVFNVATVPGNSYTYKFDRTGFYSVSCDVHETMHADIFVTSAPYAVVADESGAFTFPDVAAGSYTLALYSGGRRIERPIEVTGPRTEVTVSGE